jgi:ABC transport system ATP-binding/permease protein
MIEVSAGELASYDGGYTEYLELSTERAERQVVLDARRKKLIAQELEWAKRSPPARTGKQKARIQRARGLAVESRAFQAKQIRDLSLHAPDSQRLGRTVLNLHGVSKSFGDRTLIRNFSTMLRAGERIGIIGPNGAGKTTLIRMILGEDAPDSGAVELGLNTRIAYFDQLRSQLDEEASVYEAAGNTDWVEIGGRRVHLRSYLEDFLFPTERQQQKVASLSGGERNRLMLARLLMQPANLLILDEPTNDLDIITLQVLEAALLEFPGCVLMVTHDRFFLDKIATALLVFEGNAVVHRHEGGYDLYRKLRDQRDAAAQEERTTKEGNTQQKSTRVPKPEADNAPNKLTWKEQRELEGLETSIQEAEQQRDALSARLADPSLYQDAAETARVNAAFREAEAEVESLYSRWAELEERAG